VSRCSNVDANYSITSLAMATSLSGTLSPSALVVLRLITSSNLLGERQVGGLGALEDAPGIDAGLIPSAFAVARLIARSKTVGCCTRRSAGFASLSILST
jgi:hypothetical protein